jgi:hypothetical protein
MSEKFVQFTATCKDCLVLPACKEGKELYLRSEAFHNFPPLSLALPKFDTKSKSYSKALIECWVNIGHDIIDTMHKSYQNGIETHNKIPEKYMHLLVDITGALQYMVNSTSWRKGEHIIPYDSDEIKRKLKHISR